MPPPRETYLLAGLQVSHSLGVELGPLDKPLVHKAAGKIIYADHLSAEELKESYREDPTVKRENIVVDVVLGDKKLSDVCSPNLLVDYVIASHVIEHVPDLVGWLQDIRQSLKADGQLRLAVPDRRFTFDYCRQLSSLSDVVGAYASSATKPQPRQVFDHYYHVTHLDLRTAWRGEVRPDTLGHPQRHRALPAACETHLAQRWFEVHCWVFTPFSFANLMLDLCEMDLLPFACAQFVDTQRDSLEFFLALVPCDDRKQMTKSWQAVAASAHHHDPESQTSQQVARQNLLLAASQRQALLRRIHRSKYEWASAERAKVESVAAGHDRI